ncbi:collagen binding domain-containing protein [Sporosarcina soli]|uniref:Collagen binding domain-containing protein n=1 Tax=Sporosarcina soli TaxID=334736 RepID=A0ABW0TJA1_9BACL
MKKLSIFVLMLLIIGQTILGPIATVSASEIPVEESTYNDGHEEGTEEQIGEETPKPEESTLTNETDETNIEEVDGKELGTGESGSTEGEEEASDNGEDEEVNKNEEPKSDESVDTDQLGCEEQLAGEELAECDELNADDLLMAEALEFTPDEVKMDFLGLEIGDLVIKNSDDAQGVELKEGQQAKILYAFNLDLKKPYGEGSTFTFQLPQSIVVFDQSALSGTVSIPGEPSFKYETDKSGVVTVTFLDELQPGEYTLHLNFSAKFGNFGSEEDLDQEMEIPIKGSETVTLKLTFVPKTSSWAMSKEGTVESKDGKKYINWTVWTNRAGKALKDAKLNDTLGDGHELVEGSIKVEKYKVGLNGVIEPSIDTSSHGKFPIPLDDGKFSYKVTYQTEVTRVAENITETFTNDASLTNNGSTTEKAGNDVSITYGTPLSKSRTGGDKYRANWEIHYNYLGAEIEAGHAEITDVLEGKHEVDSASIKVYEVIVDANGDEESAFLLDISSYTTNLSEDNKKLVIDFAKSASNGHVTKAFKVTYDTVATEEFITGDSVVKNTVTSTNTNSSDKAYTATGTLPLGQGIFDKSKGAIDYDNKIITWKLTINAEKDLKNFIITDAFTPTDGESHQTLLKNEENKYFTIEGYDGTTTETDVTANKGYTLTFNDVIPEGSKVTITYKTKFDIQLNGTAYEKYGNSATAKWKGQSSEDNTVTKEAEYKPGDSPTGHNGYKNGSFNHITQQFTWTIAVNINKQNINDATLTDTLGGGHHIAIPDGKTLQDQISVKQLNLSSNDTGTPGNELPTEKWDVTATETDGLVTGFTITFKDLDDNQKNQAYIIEYHTIDSDEIIGQSDGSNVYKNNALFKTTDKKEYPFSKEVTVSHANELISKNALTNQNEETITWTVDVNKSHSHLGEIRLTDIPSENQLLLKDTLRIREYNMSKEGKIEYDEWKKVDASNVTFPPEGGFELTLGDLTKKGYQVEYKTFFTGGNGDEFSNKATINYEGTAGEKQETEDSNKGNFEFNQSSGGISSDKGKVKLHKVGYNPATGEKVDLKDIVFELYNITGEYKLDEATSDENGEFTFENIRYGKYVIKEVAAPERYVKSADIAFTMGGNTDILLEGNQDKIVEVINVEDIPEGKMCNNYTLTVKDQNGKPRSNVQVKFIGENGNMVVKRTDANGVVTPSRTELPAGKYQVVELGDNGDELDTLLEELSVIYTLDNCENSIQPGPSCEDFTIAVKDEEGIPRSNTTVTLKDKDSNEIATVTTNDQGEFTVPTTTPAGKYNLYEDKQFLGEVEIDYNGNNCGTTVTQAPVCEDFILTVRDVDGDILKDVKVIIKNKSDDSVVVEGITDANGEVTFKDLEPGEYEVYEEDASTPFDRFVVDITCEAEVQPAPTCKSFTIVVKDEEGNPRPNVQVTVKDAAGNVIPTYGQSTDEYGKITLPTTTKPGTYSIYEGELLFKTPIEVSYKEDCYTEVQGAPYCEDFTLTVQDRSGNPRANVLITVKDALGTTVIETETTDDGVVKILNKIEQGTYSVYEGTRLVNSFTVEDECEAIVKQQSSGGGGTPPTPQTCDIFTVTVKQEGVEVGADVELTLKSGATEVPGKTNANGKIVFAKDNLSEGTYTVLDKDGNEVGSLTVTYTEGECQTEIDLASKTCDAFTLTVKQSGELVEENTKVTLKDQAGNTIATGTTDANGKLVFEQADLPAGTYTVYDENDQSIGTVKVSYTEGECQAEIDLAPKTCDAFTLTVKHSGELVEAATEVTLKDQEGNTIATGTTNVDGKLVFEQADLPAGTYTAYDKDGQKVGTVAVSYEEGKCQAELDLTPNQQVCTVFTLTVQNRNSNPQVGVSITIKDSADHVITHEGKESFVTDQNGQITIGLLTSGAYKVYVDGNLLGEFTVNDTCSAIVKPRSSGGGGGGGGGGGTPPTKPEEPSEPDKPGETEEPENPETSEPGESGTETPGSGTTDPGTPGTETPGSGTTDPGTPGTETPGTSTTDPGTPGAETPSVSEPGLPGAEVAGAGEGKPRAPGAGEKAGNKLPQTGEAFPIGSIAGGLGAIALGAWLLFRRKREAQQ